jgi:AraC-like DNA-binding protein
MKPRSDEPTLPAVHALHLVEVLGRWQVTPEALLGPLGLSPDALADPGARLPIPTVERLVARARTLTGEPALGLYLGLQMRVSAHGYLGFAAMSASTVREALELAERFAPTRTSALALRLTVDGELASLVIEERAPLGAAQDVVILALLVGIAQIGRALTGRELAGQAEVAFPEPRYLVRFREVLGPRMRFGQPAHRLRFAAANLDLPLTMADPAALRLAREQCERELAALGADAEIAVAVRRALPLPAGGFRDLDEVAARLGRAPRTLKRHLAAAGTSFSELLDEARRARALLLLGAPRISLEDVAERVGYSDLANFTRAFRRWTGKTPGAFRRRT